MLHRIGLVFVVSLLAVGNAYAQTKAAARKFITDSCANVPTGETVGSIQLSVTFEGDKLVSTVKKNNEDGSLFLNFRHIMPLSEIDPANIATSKEKASGTRRFVMLKSLNLQNVSETEYQGPNSSDWKTMTAKQSSLTVLVRDQKTAEQVKNAILFLLNPNTR
jgi:hypothetical protein